MMWSTKNYFQKWYAGDTYTKRKDISPERIAFEMRYTARGESRSGISASHRAKERVPLPVQARR